MRASESRLGYRPARQRSKSSFRLDAAQRKKNKKKKAAPEPTATSSAIRDEPRTNVPPIVRLPSSGRLQTGLILFAAVYIVTVWLDGVGSNLPAKVTPRVWLYFSQVAALFKNAGVMAIDYRAEGWSCAEKKWIEVDTRPWFQLDADNKESRFHRVMQFYRKDRKVMRALEDYVIKNNNATPGSPTIGGVRFLSLRIPYPKIGDRIEPIAWKKLAEYPEDMRHHWYWTPTSQRKDRCGDKTPAHERDKDPSSTPASSSPASSSSTTPSSEKDPEP